MNLYSLLLLGLCFLHFFIFIFLYSLYMFSKRKEAIQKGEVKIREFKAYSNQISENLMVLQNYFNNQFQLPVVFYFLSLAFVALEAADLAAFTLGLLFILSRAVHSFIHLGRNNVIHRAGAYFLGMLCLLVMWVHFILKLASSL